MSVGFGWMVTRICLPCPAATAQPAFGVIVFVQQEPVAVKVPRQCRETVRFAGCVRGHPVINPASDAPVIHLDGSGRCTTRR